jgi:hypothetical protein
MARPGLRSRRGAWLSCGRAPGRVAVALFGLVAVAGCADDGGPRLLAAMPSSARRSATVTLTGRRLCGARSDCTTAAGEVQLGIEPPMVRAIVVSYADTTAQIVIPPAAPVGGTSLIVTVGERSSNALDFEVLP